MFQVGASKTALTASATSLSVAVPAGTQQGDLLLAMVAAGGSATVTAGGWSQATASFTSGTTRYQLYFRIAGAGEPASYAFTFSASSKHIGSITALRNASAASPPAATAVGSSVNITAPGVVPVVNDSAIAVFVGQAQGDTNAGSIWSFPSTFAQGWEASTGSASGNRSAAGALRILVGGAGVTTGTTLVTSQTGSTTSAAWGAITAAIAPAQSTATQTRYGYLGGKQRVTSTGPGIIEMGARLYDPTLGRFLQVDPVWGGSANAYDYVRQDPIDGVDLDGRRCADAPCRNGGRVAGCIIYQTKCVYQHGDSLLTAAGKLVTRVAGKVFRYVVGPKGRKVAEAVYNATNGCATLEYTVGYPNGAPYSKVINGTLCFFGAAIGLNTPTTAPGH